MAQGKSSSSIEAKAKAAASKSEGMRLLYDAGYSVAATAKILDVGYAFAYGVAKRAGKADTAAKRRAPRAVKQARREAKATPAAKAPSARKSTPAKRGPGRPRKVAGSKAATKAKATR